MNEIPATEPPLIFLIAGEPSGDALGARMMTALKEHYSGALQFAGVGGPKMAAEGLESLFPMEELSVMGLAEVLPRLPNLYRRIGQTVARALELAPAAIVTIDSPGFTLRVSEKLAGKGIPLIHYVAPSVWAWKPGRARQIAQFLDHLLALLPFEPKYMTTVGLACTFVGHPVVESGADKGDGAAFRKRHGIPGDIPLVCMLPGSRRSETSRLLPVFGATLGLLKEAYPNMLAVVPCVQSLAKEVLAGATRWPMQALVLEDESEKYDAFAACNAAIAASGTVSLELALAGTPMVIAYRINPLTAWFALKMVKINYVTLINILSEQEAIPEFIQDNCTPENLFAGISEILENPAAGEGQLSVARERLTELGMGGPAPSKRAAEVVADIVAKYNAAKTGEGSDVREQG